MPEQHLPFSASLIRTGVVTDMMTIHGIAHRGLTRVEIAEDLPQLLRDQIQHFFENYKTLEPGKWVKVQGWANAAEAKKAFEASVKAYKG